MAYSVSALELQLPLVSSCFYRLRFSSQCLAPMPAHRKAKPTIQDKAAEAKNEPEQACTHTCSFSADVAAAETLRKNLLNPSKWNCSSTIALWFINCQHCQL